MREDSRDGVMEIWALGCGVKAHRRLRKKYFIVASEPQRLKPASLSVRLRPGRKPGPFKARRASTSFHRLPGQVLASVAICRFRTAQASDFALSLLLPTVEIARGISSQSAAADCPVCAVSGP